MGMGLTAVLAGLSTLVIRVSICYREKFRGLLINHMYNTVGHDDICNRNLR